MGALQRRFERDRNFQHGDIIAGPAATPAGNGNADLALRYGTYKPKARPSSVSLFGVHVLWGRDAADWAVLSDMEANYCIVSKRLAVGWN